MAYAEPYLPPAIYLTTDASLMLPTVFASTCTAAEPFGEVTRSTTIRTVTSQPICAGCEGGFYGFSAPAPTATKIGSAGDATHVTGGILWQEPSSVNQMWYRRPWTGPATWLLAAYSVLSLLALVMLVFSGRMDCKGNLSFGRSSRRRSYERRLDLWRIDEHAAMYSAPRDAGLEDAVQAARYRAFAREWARMLQERGHLDEAEQRSTVSAAETEIPYEDEDARAHHQWLRENASDAEEAIEMRSYPVRQSSRGAQSQDDRQSRLAEAGSVRRTGHRSRSAQSLHRLASNQREQRERTMGLYELNQLHHSMARAGWMG